MRMFSWPIKLATDVQPPRHRPAWPTDWSPIVNRGEAAVVLLELTAHKALLPRPTVTMAPETWRACFHLTVGPVASQAATGS